MSARTFNDTYIDAAELERSENVLRTLLFYYLSFIFIINHYYINSDRINYYNSMPNKFLYIQVYNLRY